MPMLLVCVYYCSTYYKAVCVYYCRTYYKAVRGGGGTREEPGTLITQGGALFSLVPLVWVSLGIEPKTPGWLVQAQPPAHRGI